VVAAWLIGVGLSAIRAAPTRNGLDDLYLVAVVTYDQMADVDDAISAGEGVVLVFGGWVRVGCSTSCK